jgi:MFS family permease
MEMRESGSGHAQAVVIGAHMSLPVEREADKEPLPLPLSLPRTCIRRDGDESYHIKFMYVSAMLYFFSLGLTSISLVFLINRRIAGDPTDPNSSSILVQTTVVFLNNASSFLCLRYNSGLGDYLGRKPILAFSAFALMVTRLCYSFAHKPVHFFIISFFAGATESFFYSTLAWVCDIIPSHSERSKYYGTFAGIAGMAGIVIGSPVGAALSIAVSPTAPFLASTVFSLLSVAVTILNPCCDTHALESMSSSEYISISEKRALPKDFCHFFTEHFPISKTTFEIIMQSKKPMDWVTFFVAQWTWALLVLILVQFLLKVYDWSGPLAAFCLLSMGLSLGAFVPCMQNRFEPVSLSFYSMGCQVVGYTLLSISGTGVSGYIYIGVAGLVFVALGLSWLPCSQSILMSGYEYGMQGQCFPLVNFLF